MALSNAGARAPLSVLFVTTEMHDFVRVGGLGAVSAALPRALRRSSDLRIILAGYRDVVEQLTHAEVVGQCAPMAEMPACALARAATRDGLPVYIALCPRLYDRPGIRMAMNPVATGPTRTSGSGDWLLPQQSWPQAVWTKAVQRPRSRQQLAGSAGARLSRLAQRGKSSATFAMARAALRRGACPLRKNSRLPLIVAVGASARLRPPGALTLQAPMHARPWRKPVATT
jgi:Starch synthase catalytic domain